MNPRKIVLDTGVLYAAFDAGDVKHHATSIAGMSSLNASNTRLIAPSSIVLETAKRLQFDVGPTAMQTATAAMLETLEVLDTTPQTISSALELIHSMGKWVATLEDAILINAALALGAPVWTFNYRDFGSVKNLEFWTP